MKSPRVKYYRARARAHGPSLGIIYYSRYQRINIHAGAYGSTASDVFSIGDTRSVRFFSIPAEYHYPLGSPVALSARPVRSPRVRGISISQPNEVSLSFLVFFLDPILPPPPSLYLAILLPFRLLHRAML